MSRAESTLRRLSGVQPHGQDVNVPASPSSDSPSPEPLQLQQLPLFPLQTVLFPGGWLPLRIFEVRYLDMIKRCHQAGAPFGVVCLSEGTEVRRVNPTAPPAATASRVRCSTRSAHWHVSTAWTGPSPA
jgi:hypothetical protein